MTQRYHIRAGQHVANPRLRWNEAAGDLFTDGHLIHDIGSKTLRDPANLGRMSFVGSSTPSYPFLSSTTLDSGATQPENSRQMLPQPEHILLSQASSASCLACGKTQCVLQSHKHYSKTMLTTARSSGRRSGLSSPLQHTDIELGSSLGLINPSIQQYPIAMDAERQRLLSLWSQDWAPTRRGPERHLFPTRFIDRILPVAMTYAPLFQSLLAVSATFWSLANHTLDELAVRHLQCAAHLLSQACPTEQAASSNESMLSAILIMLAYLAQGDGFEVDRHTSGLVHLAALRGGLYYLGLSGLVADMLMYADHMQALFFDRNPIWKLTLPPLEIGLPPTIGQGFRSMISTTKLDDSVIMAASSLGRLTDIFSQISLREKVPVEAMNAIGYLSTISEYQLARCNALHQQSSTRNECVSLALATFDLIVLRNDGSITPIVRKIEYRFWTAFESAEANGSLRGLPPCLLLWMLITGLSVCVHGECQWRPFAIEKMRVVRLSAAIYSWELLRTNVLERYLWLRPTQEETFRQIWREVEGLKSMSRANDNT